MCSVQTVQHDVNDDKIAHLQRVLGELRGSMEGVKIRIEVEGEGWRGRVDRLEKELESIKEVDEEMLAAKHDFKNELTIKLSEFMADTEKLLQREREQVILSFQQSSLRNSLRMQQADCRDHSHTSSDGIVHNACSVSLLCTEHGVEIVVFDLRCR